MIFKSEPKPSGKEFTRRLVELSEKVAKHQYLFCFRFRLENYKFYFLYNRESIPVSFPTKKEEKAG